jgi:hypothetical protein
VDDVELLSGLTWQLKGFQVDLPGPSRTYHGLRLAQLVGSTLGWWVQLLPRSAIHDMIRRFEHNFAPRSPHPKFSTSENHQSSERLG